MFGEVVNPTIKIGAKKWYTLPLSIIIHTVVLGAIVIIPLMAVGAVPTPSGMAAAVAPAATRTRRRPDQSAGPGEKRQSGVPLHRAISARAGCGHHRSDDRARRPRHRHEGPPLDSAARSGGGRCGEAVDLHADPA